MTKLDTFIDKYDSTSFKAPSVLRNLSFKQSQ